MKEKGRRLIGLGAALLVGFLVWTILVLTIDVQPVGVNGTDIGFATINIWVHQLTGVHMAIYTITDWLGLVPVFVCMIFGVMGCVQWIKRGSLFKVDYDIICLGIYYVLVIIAYLLFEEIPINYRPVLIDGVMEVSYPSSTTLLVLGVMPTLVEQVSRRVKTDAKRRMVKGFVIVFSSFMVLGRLIAGVHWLTDIVGSIVLGMGLFCFYKAAILLYEN